MNIVVVGPQYPDSLARCIFETLNDMGHNVYSADERKILLSSHLPRGYLTTDRLKIGIMENFLMKAFPKFELYVYDRLCSIIEPYKPDLIMTFNASIPPQTADILKQRTGAKIVCWFPDHPGNLRRQYVFGSNYDALFFKDHFLVDLGKRINKKAFYLPECMRPKWHRRVELSNEDREKYGCDITIAGNMYYYRSLILEHLIKDYDVKIWGPPIPRWLRSSVANVHQRHYVAELDKAKAFGAAKICLNTFQGEVYGVNVRTFEIAGCGGFQICEYRPEIKEFFTLGEEIVVFHSLKDLKGKIDYYLVHPEERQVIADKAYERAHREHTYERRLVWMLDIIKSL